MTSHQCVHIVYRTNQRVTHHQLVHLLAAAASCTCVTHNARTGNEHIAQYTVKFPHKMLLEETSHYVITMRNFQRAIL
jgi:hypothetical protein